MYEVKRVQKRLEQRYRGREFPWPL